MIREKDARPLSGIAMLLILIAVFAASTWWMIPRRRPPSRRRMPHDVRRFPASALT